MAASFPSILPRLFGIAALLCGMAGAPAHAQDGSVDAGQSKSLTCAACHGQDGNSVTPEWPNLAGQHRDYIVRQLHAFKDKERQDAGMQGFASTLSDQDMQDLGAYFEAQDLHPRGADPDLVMLGQQIYRGGIPERGVAACIACHGPAGAGNPLAAYPRLSGQHATYVFNTLQAYASGQRRSDAEMNQMMRNVSELLFENEMRALASYVQGLR
jgi:cytochrome c553